MNSVVSLVYVYRLTVSVAPFSRTPATPLHQRCFWLHVDSFKSSSIQTDRSRELDSVSITQQLLVGIYTKTTSSMENLDNVIGYCLTAFLAVGCHVSEDFRWWSSGEFSNMCSLINDAIWAIIGGSHAGSNLMAGIRSTVHFVRILPFYIYAMCVIHLFNPQKPNYFQFL